MAQELCKWRDKRRVEEFDCGTSEPEIVDFGPNVWRVNPYDSGSSDDAPWAWFEDKWRVGGSGYIELYPRNDWQLGFRPTTVTVSLENYLPDEYGYITLEYDYAEGAPSSDTILPASGSTTVMLPLTGTTDIYKLTINQGYNSNSTCRITGISFSTG